MTKELIYYIGGNKSNQLLTEVVRQVIEVESDRSLITNLASIVVTNGVAVTALATCLRKFYSPPPLDTLYSWQSFVNERFPDITWAAKVKVEMKELDTVDRPKDPRINREFTLTLKEVV